MRLKRAFAAILCMVIGGGLGAAAGRLSQSPSPQHVVLIVLDAFRADRLGARRAGESITPNLDKLAARGRVFSNCYSTCSCTKPSMASILTGTCQAYHGVLALENTIPENCDTLVSMLARNGFHTACVQTNPWLTPEMHDGLPLTQYGFHKGFEQYRYLPPPAASKSGGRDAYAEAPVVNRTAQGILSAAEGRVFLYVHYMETHQPYLHTRVRQFTGRYLPAGDPRNADDIHADDRALVDKSRFSQEKMSAADIRRLREVYDEAVHYADYMVGRLLDTVDRTLGLDKTLVIVTADHGEEFAEHGGFGHPCELYEELVRVPLIIAGPGAGRGRVAYRVSNMNLYKTIKALVCPDEPGREDVGLSLMGRKANETILAQVMVYSPQIEQCKLTKLIRPDGQAAIIRTALAGDVLGVKRFDLNNDPGELEALGGDDAQVFAQQAQRLLRDWQGLARRDAIAGALTGLRWQWRWDNTQEAEAETSLSDNELRLRDQLRALGYFQ